MIKKRCKKHNFKVKNISTLKFSILRVVQTNLKNNILTGKDTEPYGKNNFFGWSYPTRPELPHSTVPGMYLICDFYLRFWLWPKTSGPLHRYRTMIVWCPKVMEIVVCIRRCGGLVVRVPARTGFESRPGASPQCSLRGGRMHCNSVKKNVGLGGLLQK